MNEAILIWLYLSLENIMSLIGNSAIVLTSLWGLVTGFFAILTLFGSGYSASEYELDIYRFLVKPWKSILITAIVVNLLISFYPSRDDLKWIIGGAVVWNVAEAGVESEELQALPDNVLSAMNHFLESVQEEQE